MPFAFTCTDHGTIGETTDEVMAHARTDHPGQMVVDLRDAGVITSSFMSQVEAQGNAARHIVRCDTCGTTTEITQGAARRCADCEGNT